VLSATRSFSTVLKRKYCQNVRTSQLKIYTTFLLRPTLATVITIILLLLLSVLLLLRNISKLVTSRFQFLYTFRTRCVASNAKGSAMAVEHVKATHRCANCGQLGHNFSDCHKILGEKDPHNQMQTFYAPIRTHQVRKFGAILPTDPDDMSQIAADFWPIFEFQALKIVGCRRMPAEVCISKRWSSSTNCEIFRGQCPLALGI